jgi:SOS regulatory protein LexA
MGEVIMNHESEPEVYRDSEVTQIPMYSDIAAGEPIYINDELESNFCIPKFWVRGMKDCFILKVKGDSMIGADINDGDFVVIQNQYAAQNGDIVAADLDGSATLKRLSIKKDGVLLIPENEKYKPIPMNEDNSSIMGVAIGIIKSKH